MRKLIILGLMAATVAPVTAASAQSQGEIRRDRRDVREQERQLDNAYRRGDARDIRDERGDVRDARRELREDVNDRNRQWGRNDWRNYRQGNRGLYSRGNWNSPYRYRVFRPGVTISAGYFAPRYVIADPWRYRLPIARPGTRWVRFYDDVLLVDTRRGVVLDVIRGFYW